jgi:hypothetical protein
MGLALASNAAAAPGNQITGGGISSFGTTFGFTAHDRGDGGVSGHATFKNKAEVAPQADRKGHVVCLTVDNNRAVFAVRDPNEANPGTFLIKQYYVEDNGTGGSPKGTKDRLTEVNPNNCQFAADNAFALPISNGNIEVRAR